MFLNHARCYDNMKFLHAGNTTQTNVNGNTLTGSNNHFTGFRLRLIHGMSSTGMFALIVQKHIHQQLRLIRSCKTVHLRLYIKIYFRDICTKCIIYSTEKSHLGPNPAFIYRNTLMSRKYLLYYVSIVPINFTNTSRKKCHPCPVRNISIRFRAYFT